MRFMLAVALLSVSYSAQALDFGRLSDNQLRQIAKNGAPSLAISLLEEQSGETRSPNPWFALNRLRNELLIESQQWDLAVAYLRDLPASLPIPMQRWALSQRAWLQLQRNNPVVARALLRELLWSDEPATPAEHALWRRLIVRSYLLEGRIADAKTAILRYRQDGLDADQPQWLQLYARVLLRQGEPATILNWPRAMQRKLPHTLLLLAQLNARTRDPADIVAEAQRAIANPRTAAANRARYQLIVAEAQARLGNAHESISALEEAMRSAVDLSGDAVFTSSADQLWQRYLAYGREAANLHQLLIGDESAWIDAAYAAFRRGDPVQAKSLLIALYDHARSSSWRRRALSMLARIYHSEPKGGYMATRLLVDDDRIALLAMPDDLRYLLIDYALERSDIVRASEILATLAKRPERVSVFDWNLRRARVFVLGDRLDEGIRALNNLLDDQLFLSQSQVDRVLQVIFDLQSAGLHRQAIAAFRRLEETRHLPEQQHRELFFWIAESLMAQKKYPQAALYYLRSAGHGAASDGNDRWGQSARYHAAAALRDAGMQADARRIYEDLLAGTADASRQTLLRNRLQQLLSEVQ